MPGDLCPTPLRVPLSVKSAGLHIQIGSSSFSQMRVCIYSFSFVHMCVLVLAARKIIQCMSVLGAHACRYGFLLACMPAASETLMMFMLLSSSRTSTVSCRHVSA